MIGKVDNPTSVSIVLSWLLLPICLSNHKLRSIFNERRGIPLIEQQWLESIGIGEDVDSDGERDDEEYRLSDDDGELDSDDDIDDDHDDTDDGNNDGTALGTDDGLNDIVLQ